MQKILFSFLFLTILISGCKKDEVDQAAEDKAAIEAYLEENNLEAESLSTGLYYIIEELGIGDDFPNTNSIVKISYTGYLLNGDEFDSTAPGQPIELPLADVIDGWKQGIPLFKKGGKGKLLIPSELGYGDRAIGGIPANSVLVFDITLVDY